MNTNSEHPPVIDYEDSDYQTSFWDEGGREYEDQTENVCFLIEVICCWRSALEPGGILPATAVLSG